MYDFMQKKNNLFTSQDVIREEVYPIQHDVGYKRQDDHDVSYAEVYQRAVQGGYFEGKGYDLGDGCDYPAEGLPADDGSHVFFGEFARYPHQTSDEDGACGQNKERHQISTI